MNEQQLQQILTIQQAIAAAATAAVINSLLNPQQAAGLASANALSDSSSNDLQLAAVAQHLAQQQQQQQQQQHRDSPSATSPTSLNPDCNNRIQDLLMQLQQQASLGQSPVALNLNLSNQQQQQQQHQQQSQGLNSPISSPVSRLSGVQELNTATSSNILSQASPIKKLKTRHHQQASPLHNQQQQQQQQFHNRSSEATSKPQHSTPKNHSTISSLGGAGRNSNTGNHNNTSSSSSSSFITNNVGLPRKLVRGQDVWLGRGAEQTKQILKCMWCGQSFRTLAELTQHMRISQHYTNIISQEQITSWRQPESSETNSKQGNKQTIQSRGLEDNHDDHSSDKFNDTDREDSFSNDDDLDQQKDRTTQINRILNSSNKSDSIDNNSISESMHDDQSPDRAQKDSPGSKPLTRSRRRENETVPIKLEDERARESSPANSSSSQTNNSICAEKDSKDDLGDIKECKSNGNSQDHLKQESDGQTEVSTLSAKTESDKDDDDNLKTQDGDDAQKSDSDIVDKSIQKKKVEESTTANFSDNDADDDDDGDDDGVGDNQDAATTEQEDLDQNNIDEDRASETNESAATTMTASGLNIGSGQRITETGDPLSALETMVEKSFDPRMRPDVATGGILQRLGIDEEVCPPWQHINYANWYAAAAYGHPMAAAALLAAGINLQNGIKLSKNVAPKKNEE